MACIDDWSSTTYYDQNNEHYLTVDTSYEYVTVSTQVGISVEQLPDGMTVDDLCDYQTSDKIVVHFVTKVEESTPGAMVNPVNMYTGYKKTTNGGFHVQIIIIDLSETEPDKKRKKIKRTTNTLSEM